MKQGGKSKNKQKKKSTLLFKLTAVMIKRVVSVRPTTGAIVSAHCHSIQQFTGPGPVACSPSLLAAVPILVLGTTTKVNAYPRLTYVCTTLEKRRCKQKINVR